MNVRFRFRCILFVVSIGVGMIAQNEYGYSQEKKSSSMSSQPR